MSVPGISDQESTPLDYSREVCIIGAGVSGLRAAGLLSESTLGFNVTILEARNRVGGRIEQSDHFGIPVDLGASWIHGTEGNPLVALAEDTKSPTVACGDVYSICDERGQWLDRELARRHYEEVWDILELAMEKSKSETKFLLDTGKMMDFYRKEIHKRSTKAQDPDTYASLMLQIVEMWGAFMGDDCERQSLKNLWLEAGLEGDNLFMASTYKGIIDKLLEPLGDRTLILKECEVTKISNRSHGIVEVEAADGFRGFFGHVVMTTPLGWLKRNETVFSPPFPPKLSNAIRSLGYGNLDRVFIKFPRAFWNDHIADGTNNGQITLDGGEQDQPEPAFPIESLFLQPRYATDTNPAKWRTEIISFSGLPSPFAQPVIMFFTYGQWGRHITGLVRGLKQDSMEYCRILNENFRPYYSKLPNFDSASIDCQPSAFLSTDWQNDKFAGYGSFTNQPVGAGDCAEHFETLREGLGQDRGIWFAGEHVSPPGGVGTVVGAYWSGEEAAKRVITSYERDEAAKAQPKD